MALGIFEPSVYSIPRSKQKKIKKCRIKQEISIKQKIRFAIPTENEKHGYRSGFFHEHTQSPATTFTSEYI